MPTENVGILHPGAMGISVAATIRNSGYPVYWVSEGRGGDTRQRAAEHQLTDAGTLSACCSRCGVIISVCPPHAAEAVAEAVLAQGFQGVYVDANAISPQKAQAIEQKMQAAGVRFVDGGIIGGPAWKPGTTWLYLSGPEAEPVAQYFAAGPLETDVIGDVIGRASALKMCFAANTKGTTALLTAILGLAESLGVRSELERQWTRYDSDMVETTHRRVQNVTQKAWRFAGEMEEIASTFAAAGYPAGFHQAANDIYQRIAQFKDAEDLPALTAILAALAAPDTDNEHD